MAFDNYNALDEMDANTTSTSKSYWLGLITVNLGIALLATWAYIFWDKNNKPAADKPITTSVTSVSPQTDDLKKLYADATIKFDNLKTDLQFELQNKDSIITQKDIEIAQKKQRIQELIAKVNASADEIAEAKHLIGSLNGDIEGYKTQVQNLNADKRQLSQDKSIVTKEIDNVKSNIDSIKTIVSRKDEIIKQQNDIIFTATTLNASNFSIAGISERKNNKERLTVTAKKVDKLQVSFDLGENRIAQSGPKDIYICITGPDGSPLSVEAFGSGKLQTKEGDEVFYTQKIDVNYIQGQRQTVSIYWKQNINFASGNYKITVYHNGLKIGEGTRFFK